MNMNDFYRQINNFKDVIEVKLKQSLVEQSDGVDRDKLLAISDGIKSTMAAGFDDLISSLMNLENKNRLSKKNNILQNKARKGRSRTK